MRHELKSWPEFFAPVRMGIKNFELRRNQDRNFQIGDVVLLREFEPKTGMYSGETIEKRITYIMHGVGTGGIEPLKGLGGGYVILQLADV